MTSTTSLRLQERIMAALVEHMADQNDGMRPGEVGQAIGVSPQVAAKVLQGMFPDVLATDVYRTRENVKGYGNFCGERTERFQGYAPSSQFLAKALLEATS